ncbi:hypothetical protein WN51_12044 [Melipona quadrifasciata]|uniref:Uncharacterized protein n=1 Tax=Melipona quadrifasciata TaxID=166423 RepID=A0A0M9A299_9HYME|nr:hypothetical protein WN51_12044 [Melipona quadrifasciata]
MFTILTPGGPGGPRKPGTPIDPSRPGSPFSPGRPGRPSRPSKTEIELKSDNPGYIYSGAFLRETFRHAASRPVTLASVSWCWHDRVTARLHDDALSYAHSASSKNRNEFLWRSIPEEQHGYQTMSLKILLLEHIVYFIVKLKKHRNLLEFLKVQRVFETISNVLCEMFPRQICIVIFSVIRKFKGLNAESLFSGVVCHTVADLNVAVHTSGPNLRKFIN